MSLQTHAVEGGPQGRRTVAGPRPERPFQGAREPAHIRPLRVTSLVDSMGEFARRVLSDRHAVERKLDEGRMANDPRFRALRISPGPGRSGC